jgi:hypothetical protein
MAGKGASLLPPTRVAKPTGRTAPKPKTVTTSGAMKTGPFGAKQAGLGGGKGGKAKDTKRG